MPDVEIITFGCRLNALEAEAMRGRAAAAGLEDAVIVNTCAVTAEAERQARQAIRRARRERPQARIIVTGCAAQINPLAFAAMSEVDEVVGNREKLHSSAYRPAPSNRIRVADIMASATAPPSLPAAAAGGRRVRGFLDVQQGCEHRCTFCVIPYGRGNSRSVPVAAVLATARALVAAGCREIVLSGVDLTAYGADLPEQPTLGRLVRRLLAQIPELARLRLSSLDPVEIDEALWQALAEEERLMPHLHLSLQAGDDLVLKRMKRRHSRRDAVEACRRARALRPGIALGADLIAGFPGESEAMFANTLDLLAACDLTHLHVFPFSLRPGTPAARMPQLPGPLIRERAARLREAGSARHLAWLTAQLGRTASVLAERGGTGYSPHYAAVRLGPSVPYGRIVTARLTGLDGSRLIGEAAEP